MFKLTRLSLIAILAAVPMIAACSDDDDDNPTGPSQGMALARVAHLSPDAPNVDVWVDGTRVLQNVPFKAVSAFLELAAGDREILVVEAGTTTPAVIDATVTVADGGIYTIAARGLVGDGSINATVLETDRTPDAAGAKLTFVHMSPDAPPVDITLADATVLFDGVSFPNDQDGVSVPTGAYDLQVRVDGTDTVVLSFDDVPVTAGQNYSVFAVGLVGDGTLDAIVAVDTADDGTSIDLEAATAEVRVGHLAPEVGPVDVYVDGELELEDVNFQDVTDAYLTLPARSTNFQVFAANTTTNPAIDATAILNPGIAYSVLATGLASDLQATIFVDDRTPSGANAHVRFGHTSPDAPPVNIVVAGGPTLFTNRMFRTASEYASVAPGTYTLEVRLTSDDSLALTVPGVSLATGTNYTIFAAGLAGDMSLTALPEVDSE